MRPVFCSIVIDEQNTVRTIEELNKITRGGQEKIKNSYNPLELDKAVIYKKKKYDSGKRNWK